MNKLPYIRAGLAVVIGILTITAFSGLYYPLPFLNTQLLALLQRVAVDLSLAVVILLGGIVLLTFLFGRVYCSTLCPLGLFQELLQLLFRPKRAAQKNKPYKYFLAAVVLGTMLGGSVYIARLIDPYSIFGNGVSGAWWGVGCFVLLVIAVALKGRVFCANICPVGAVLGLMSKHAVNQIYITKDSCISCGLCASKCPTGSINFKEKQVDNETCVKCFKCLNACRKNSMHYGVKPAENVPFEASRRRLVLGGAAMVFILAVKGGVELTKKISAKVKKFIVPAGAVSAEDFANKCLNCNLCVQNCPMKILKKANEDYPCVHIDYSESFCDYDCHKCSEVCPSGAIKKLTLAEKQKTQIGVAEIDENICIKCGLCVMKCPRQVIEKEEGAFPVVNTNECIGCGACQSACPVHAIKILPVERQKSVK